MVCLLSGPDATRGSRPVCSAVWGQRAHRMRQPAAPCIALL